jgi:all-trans-8'-apo-beta-carotenal 15,15'-oxygenase
VRSEPLPEPPLERSAIEDHAPRLEEAFGVQACEGAYQVRDIEGRIPAFVRGVYYRNGPARFESGGLAYRHWLDGDGMICALRFDDKAVRFTARFVRTAKLVAEEAAGGPLFRTFGTSFPGDRLRRGIVLESPANVSVHPFCGTLLAFGEQSLPWELDPETLVTRSEFDFGGRLNEISPFAAHPKFDLDTGEMFNFGVAFPANRPRLTLYRFERHGALQQRKSFPLEFPCPIHDFALSARHACFYISPYVLDMDLMLGGHSPIDALRWQPERGSSLLVVSRETGESFSVAVGHRYCLHVINSFDEGDYLSVDVLEFDRPIYEQYRLPDLYSGVGQGEPVRLVVDVKARAVIARKQIDYRLAPDFPTVAPHDSGRPYDHFWMLGMSAAGRPGRKFFDQLVHSRWSTGEVSTYQAPPRQYLCGDPVFVGDPADASSGAVIVYVFDADRRRSSFLVFDAFDIARGPTARVHLRTPVHFGFHAAFAGFHPDESPRDCTLRETIE